MQDGSGTHAARNPRTLARTIGESLRPISPHDIPSRRHAHSHAGSNAASRVRE
jgi:hypothetical protein